MLISMNTTGRVGDISSFRECKVYSRQLKEKVFQAKIVEE